MELHSIIKRYIEHKKAKKSKDANSRKGSSSSGRRHDNSDDECDLTFNAMVYKEIRKQLGKNSKGSSNSAQTNRKYFVFVDCQRQQPYGKQNNEHFEDEDHQQQHDSSDEEISDLLSWRQVTSEQEVVKLMRKEYNNIIKRKGRKSSKSSTRKR